MIKSESPYPIIRFTRDGDIEPSRAVAIRALDTFEQLVGQPVLVRYYTSPAKDDIDCMVAIGIKDGIGPDCYHIMSPFDKSIIWGIATTYEEVDVAKFPTGREKYIFIDPNTQEAKYVILNEFKEREFIDINDGPKAYEDISTGRTIYIASVDGKISVCAGYSDDDIRRIAEGKLNIKQEIEDGNKVVVTDENGNITFTPKTTLISAGDNINIDEDNKISVVDVAIQLSELPEASEYTGKVIQYIGETTENYLQNRFYKSNGTDWELVKVQSKWQDIELLTIEEFNALPNISRDILYVITDNPEPLNIVFAESVWVLNMPEASEKYDGRTYIYIGDSTEEFLKGRIYNCEKIEGTQLYEWVDISSGDAYIHSYQTYSNELPYVNNSTIFVDSFEVFEDMYKRIKKMSSFSGVIEVAVSEEQYQTLPIIRINGLKDMTDDNPDKHTIYIDFTVIDPTTNLPHRLVINANKQSINNPYKFYLTIVQ